MKKSIIYVIIFLLLVGATVFFMAKINKKNTAPSNPDLSAGQNKVERETGSGVLTFSDPYAKIKTDIQFKDKQGSVQSDGAVKGIITYKILDILQPINLDQTQEKEYPFLMEADYPDMKKIVYLAIAHEDQYNIKKFTSLDQLAIGDPSRIDDIHSAEQNKVIVDAYILIDNNKESVNLVYEFVNGKIVPGADNIDISKDQTKQKEIASGKPVEISGSDKGSFKGGKTVLTFDDGPGIYTPDVLDILKKYNVKATFFLIGNNAKDHPDLVARILAEGHEIGNHTLNHISLPKYSLQKQINEMQETNKIILGIVPSVKLVNYMRPPFGEFNIDTDKALIEESLIKVIWSVDSGDWTGKKSKDISDDVIGETKDGTVILMHDGIANSSETVKALPSIISTLKSRNFKMVKLSDI